MYGKLLILCVYIIGTQAEIEIPDYLQQFICRRSDPNYNECSRNAFEEMRPYLVKGIKELNFPPMDPFEVDYFAINRTVLDAIDINLVLKNMKMTGVKDMILQKHKTDPYKLRGEVGILIPKIHLTLEYDVKGKVFSSPVNMQGTMDGTFIDVAIATKTQFSRYTKEGVEYFSLDKFNIKFALGDGKIILTGSTPEQQATADFVMNLFNQNPRGIIDAIAPIALEQINVMAKDAINSILAQIPAQKLLPD